MRKMKDSGVEWIGEVPESWYVSKLKYLFADGDNGLKIGPFGSAIRGKTLEEGPYKIYNQAHLIQNDFNLNRHFVSEETYQQLASYRVKPGDVLFSMMGTIGKCRIMPDGYPEGIMDSHLLKAGLNQKILPEFFVYAYDKDYSEQVISQLLYASNGTIMNGLNSTILKSVVIAVPPIEKQRKIVKYLDEKCSKIDAIIARQEEIIEKLKKFQGSLISETVRRGLHMDVECKDSGYDFIGNIPTHWETCRLRNIGIPQNGISKGAEFFGHGYPFVSYGDVYRNYSLPETVSGLIDSTEKERELYSVQKGDIFFTRTSETIEEVGFSCVCEETVENACFAGFLIRVRPYNEKMYTGYAKYYFRSNHLRYYLVKEMNLVTRASLGQDLLKSMPVLVPPIGEQKEIAQYLDKKCDQINTEIAKRTKIIEKLRDYKKSLIYEIVTGKKEV